MKGHPWLYHAARLYKGVDYADETTMKGEVESRQVVWTSSKPSGVEQCKVVRKPSGWSVEGSLVRRLEDGVGVVSYRIETDGGWRTKHVVVEQIARGAKSTVELESTPSGWLVNGKKAPHLDGCVDVDLGASPVTNTFPIKRLRIKEGEKADLVAAWVNFPSLEVKPLRQSYERLGKNRYRYSSQTGFTSEIEVDSFGLVKRYGDYWVAV